MRIGMLTSGGDCQALNAAMRGIVKCLSNSGKEIEIYGFHDGYQGLIYERYSILKGAVSRTAHICINISDQSG